MRKIALISAATAAALGLAACSDRTQKAAENTAESAKDAAASVEQERAEVEAKAHNESVKEAKND